MLERPEKHLRGRLRYAAQRVDQDAVFVAQRLNHQVIEGADEKRAKRFFADAPSRR